MPTTAQVDHYRAFGFVTLRSFLPPDDVAAITRELEACTADAHQRRPFDGRERHWVPLLTPKAPTFSLLAEQRFAETAEQLLGDRVVLLIADGNRYVGDTPWHSDVGAGLQGVKFAIYLDAVAAESGALRVVPASHLEPLHSSVRSYIYPEGGEPKPIQDVPAFALPSEPGDVVAFNPPIWHASIGGAVDRRMCTWNYFRVPREEPDFESIREFTAGLVRLTDEMWPERSYPFYDRDWIANGEAGEARDRMIGRMREAGILAAAGV